MADQNPSLLAWENVKWLLTAAAIPITLGWISHRYTETSTQQQATEARVRLYTELLSKREEADSRVRQDMFGKMLDTFQQGRKRELNDQILALELLALNFNESLNLSPLFRQIEERIQAEPSRAARDALAEKLIRVANVVKDKQIEILELAGDKSENTVWFDELAKGEPINVIDSRNDPLTFTVASANGATSETLKRSFIVDVLERDRERRRLLVRVRLLEDPTGRGQWVFWVDPYDFPQVDFTRLSSKERFALVQSRPDDTSVQLTFIYFPSSRGGVKDKPYIDEVVRRLIEVGDDRGDTRAGPEARR